MWATSPNLDQAIELLKAWGFTYSTVGFVWEKRAINPGAYTMSSVELCLIGKKGNIPKPRGARNVRQFISELRTSHSTKPEEVRKRIEAMFPQSSKLELFARKKTDGWAVWGNEVDADIAIGDRDNGK
jgi:N6-adenosine-specific RNA methylase IME4